MVWNLLKFSQKLRKKDYEKELEELEAKITQVEASIKKNQIRESSFSSSWLLYSFLVYALSSFLAFYFSPPEWGPLRFLPIVIGPIFIYLGKRVLRSFFQRKIKSLETFLDFLKTELKGKVEEIKINEPYNKAKQLLERFDTPKKEEPLSPSPAGQPIRNRAHNAPTPMREAPRVTPGTPQQLGGGMLVGGPGHPGNPPIMVGPGTPQRPVPPFQYANSPQHYVNSPIQQQRRSPPPPENATWIDKLVDYAVGDSQATNMNNMLDKVQRENMELKSQMAELQRELMSLRQNQPNPTNPQMRQLHHDEPRPQEQKEEKEEEEKAQEPAPIDETSSSKNKEE